MSIVADYLTKNIKPSLTLLVDTKANELRAQGHQIISLGVGEPDFNTPDNIKTAAIEAIHNNYTKYSSSGGIKELKNAIISKFMRENNLQYNSDEICVSAGAKQVIYNAFMASLNPKEEVIILSPYWVSYTEMVKIAGGEPVIVNCDVKNNFSLPIAEIEKAITSKTKWLMLNSPNNPCGSVYTYDELRALADMLLKHEHVYILSDDIYEHLIYDQTKFHTIAEIEPKLKARVLTINGVSKAYAMTGWRIGYCGGPAELIKAMCMVQSQSTSGACSISQMAAVEALNGPQDFIQERNKILVSRRNLIVETINQIPGLKCTTPKGAFYVFVDCSAMFGKKTPAGKIINDSNDVASYILEQAHVAVVSGDAFGPNANGFFRVSYATSNDNLVESCRRIKMAAMQLS